MKTDEPLDNMVLAILTGEQKPRTMTWILDQMQAPYVERHRVRRALKRLLKTGRVRYTKDSRSWIAFAHEQTAQA